MTLDLREEFRRHRRAAVRRRVRRRRDAEPVHRAATAPSASTSCSLRSPSAWAPTRLCDGPLRADRRAARGAPRRARRSTRRKDQSLHARRRLDPRCSTGSGFPLGGRDQGRDARGGGSRPASRPRAGAESQEACFLAGGDYRALPRAATGSGRPRADVVDEAGTRARAPRRPLAVHARPAARPRGRRRASRSTRIRSEREYEHASSSGLAALASELAT